MAELNKNFLDTMAELSNDKEVSEFLGVFSIISLAIYNCESVSKGIVKHSAVDELLSQYYLDIYDLPNIKMAISMQSSALSDYIVFPKNVFRLCDPKRILPKFKGLPISPPQ
ncbi:hypothetical protein MITS9508_01292 [Synechococcus sp. MIT S9508]|nr:hypothetical protein MITS9508_01292 [Synechococcus sp. MIT S9508]